MDNPNEVEVEHKVTETTDSDGKTEREESIEVETSHKEDNGNDD